MTRSRLTSIYLRNNKGINFYFYLTLLALLINPSFSQPISGVVRGDPITAKEASALEPVCRLILIEQLNIHLEQKKPEIAGLFNRPEYRMGKNATWLHHRCYAMVSKHRYFSSFAPRSKHSPSFYAYLFHDDMSYVITVGRADWEYMPQVLVEDGEMFFIEKNYAQASSRAIQALGKNPRYARAYALLSDTYVALGEKNKALEKVIEGLKQVHDKGLIRRFKELGGTPPIPEIIKHESTQNDTPNTPTDSPKSPDSASASTPSDNAEPLKESSPRPTPPENTQPPDNPYCRFCP